MVRNTEHKCSEANRAKEQISWGKSTNKLANPWLHNGQERIFANFVVEPGDYCIEIDDSGKPKQHEPGRLAVHLKSELKVEIAELEQRQVTAKVRKSDWISRMVIVRKPTGKLRICIDPKDLNQGLRSPRYPTSSIANVLSRLSKSKVFCVLDAKDGFR